MRFYLVLHTPLINRVLAQYAIQKITVSISTAATNVNIYVIKFLSVGKRDYLKQEKNWLPKRHMYIYIYIYKQMLEILLFLTQLEYFKFFLLYTMLLESFEMWCWRRMEKISWADHVRNEEVLLRVNEQRNVLHERLIGLVTS